MIHVYRSIPNRAGTTVVLLDPSIRPRRQIEHEAGLRGNSETMATTRHHIRLFASVVRSPCAVRAAFEGEVLARLWRRSVLALHGPPVEREPGETEALAIVSAGFHLYGVLYRLVALLLRGLSLAGLPLASRPSPERNVVPSKSPCVDGKRLALLGARQLRADRRRSDVPRDLPGHVGGLPTILCVLVAVGDCSGGVVRPGDRSGDGARLSLGAGSYAIESVSARR